MGDDENTYFKVFLDVHDHLGEVHLKTTVFIIYYNSCYNNIVKRPFPGTPLGKCFTPSCYRCWTSALAQTVMLIQKQIQTTVFSIPYNLCYNNIVKIPFPGTTPW